MDKNEPGNEIWKMPKDQGKTVEEPRDLLDQRRIAVIFDTHPVDLPDM